LMLPLAHLRCTRDGSREEDRMLIIALSRIRCDGIAVLSGVR